MIDYRDTHGITYRSLAAFPAIRRKLGRIRVVAGVRHEGQLCLEITGTRGRAVFSGLTLGYGGTGPAGSVAAMRRLGMAEGTAITLVQLREPWSVSLVAARRNLRPVPRGPFDDDGELDLDSMLEG